MPRANRHFLLGQVWHFTHHCHKQDFLLKFSKDRTNWIKWLYESRQRYGLCILNYIVTSNHIHLMVKKIPVRISSLSHYNSLLAERHSNTTNAKSAKVPTGKIAIMQRQSRAMSTYSNAWFIST